MTTEESQDTNHAPTPWRMIYGTSAAYIADANDLIIMGVAVCRADDPKDQRVLAAMKTAVECVNKCAENNA